MRHLFLMTAYLFTMLLATAQTERPAYKTAAARFKSYYNNGSYDSLFAMFSAEMKNALPLDKTSQFLTGLKTQIGNITASTFTRYEKTYASYKTNFERALAAVLISLDDQQNINGFFVRPFVEDSLPQAAVNYNSEEITYRGSATGLTYGATFTYPKTGGRFTSVILISGSGPHDRNASTINHKPLAVIADYLTNNGIAVLRVDDRGVGLSTGDFSQATTADFANDVEEHIRYLRSRPETDTARIGLCGHSEGGMVATMVAARQPQVAFVVSLAGPAVPIVGLMTRQNGDVLQSLGTAKEVIDAYLPLYADLLRQVTAAPGKQQAIQTATRLVQKWRSATRPEWVKATTGIENDSTQLLFITGITDVFYTPWWKYFAAYDPGPGISKLTCPVLAINGSRDVQVSSKANLDAYRNLLQKAGNKKATIIEMEGYNHLFQRCNTCTVDEYETIKTVMEKELLERVTAWLKNI